MQRWSYWLPIVTLTLGLTACASPEPMPVSSAAGINASDTAPTTRAETQPIAAEAATPSSIDSRGNCPTTKPSAEPFTPPPPYTPQAPYADKFWYGSEALWTMLGVEGTWQGLPFDNGSYTQKLVWWKRGYDWRAEPTPALTVSGRRLDGIAPLLITSQASNGYHEDFGSFMILGVGIPTEGCWEIIGRIDGHSLSFVVWVTP